MPIFAHEMTKFFLMMRQYNTYIFDLDGTLLDTLDDLAAAVNYTLRVFGMPEHSRDDIRRFVGNGVRLLMVRAVLRKPSTPSVRTILNTRSIAHDLTTVFLRCSRRFVSAAAVWL